MSGQSRYSMLPPEKLFVDAYEEFTSIGRTLHDEDVVDCVTSDELIPNLVPQDAFTCLSDTQIEGLWFGVAKDPTEHDWYGNIRFDIDFFDLMDYYSDTWQCYYVDQVVFHSVHLSRVLITRKTSRIPLSAIEFDLCEKGWPIWLDQKNDALYHASQVDGKKHHVEFIIDGTKDVTAWLFNNCGRVTVNHSEANKRRNGRFLHNICHKHNKFGYRCFTGTGIKKTKSRIRGAIPGFYEYDTASYHHYDSQYSDY